MRKEEVDKAYKIEHTHWWYAGTREICFDLMDRLVMSHPLTHQRRILDIGCGSGGNLERFKHYGTAEGIDCDPHAINYCIAKGLSARVASMTDLSPTESRYDLVTFFYVLNQIPFSKQGAVITRVASILSDNGFIVLREPALELCSGRHDREVGIQKRYDRTIMRTLLESAGLTVVYQSYINFFLCPLICLTRKIGLLFNDSPRSDVVETGAMLNTLLLTVLRIEKRLLRRITFPFGVSLVAIAQKRQKGTP